MSRVRSFTMAFNYLILNYLRLKTKTYICPVLTSLLDCNFIILSTCLYNHSIIIIKLEDPVQNVSPKIKYSDNQLYLYII